LINKLVIENLKHRPVRTLLSVIAISIQVTMVLTLVGLSRGMLDEQARRARGVGADIIVRAPSSSVINLSMNMPARIIPVIVEKEPHVAVATGVLLQGDLFSYVTGRRRRAGGQLLCPGTQAPHRRSRGGSESLLAVGRHL
jgi:putative ABC transport system permease protein